MEILLVFLSILAVMGGVAYVLKDVIKSMVIKSIERSVTLPIPPPAPVVNVDLDSVHRAIEAMPSKVLQSIQGSTNTYKGALGELMGYIALRASYDRIIPLGNIVDFVCVKFSKEGVEGHIDFVDIKTGDRSRLSKDQRELQKLIEEKKINFIKLKVETASEDPTL